MITNNTNVRQLADLLPSSLGMAWGLFDRLRGWRVEWVFSGGRGLTIWAHRTILIRHRQTRAEERSVLAHESYHALRGSIPRWMLPREEEHVSRAAARYLICIRALGEALAWSLHLPEVTDELDVNVPTVGARLRALHASEIAYLKRRLEHHYGDEHHENEGG